MATVEKMATYDGLPQTPSDKLAKAIQLKEEGNALFKGEEWKTAAKKYHHSLMYVKSLSGSVSSENPLLDALMKKKFDDEVSPKQKEDTAKLLVALSNNLAVCMLKMEQWENAARHTSSVLEHEPNNVKALYRRGTAYMNMGRLDDSQADLQLAMQLDPSDLSVKKQYEALQELFKNYWKGEKQKYQGMFGASQH